MVELSLNFDIPKGTMSITDSAAKKINVPHLIVHGDGDIAVPFFHAENLHSWNSKSELVNIPNANHVFGGKQPWTEDELPKDFISVLEHSLNFLLWDSL